MLYQAQVHRHAHNFREVQQCTLLSIKTGGCSEDCSYCPQSSRYDTGLKAQKLMNKDAVLEAAKKVIFFSLLFCFLLIALHCMPFYTGLRSNMENLTSCFKITSSSKPFAIKNVFWLWFMSLLALLHPFILTKVVNLDENARKLWITFLWVWPGNVVGRKIFMLLGLVRKVWKYMSIFRICWNLD